ncbi:5-dehydro-2-deoxygluconokinase [Thalassorhabdomicrobium marinisediminis]|uniref:5-dehydro-2-deoxygluconokinase n=1 Tax=Thalassorhabdomicrobium marinisediminis TaxID=2170577 RepID=A0A2T7FTQ0_9RHOB|nr:5-dehydro-2-deoxygluconokinase [Thalassorhabdomicrobium marinisediminis]PVA05540.1 5-dehydro-2-deoxygluconokinase [Thalassorhabdomicrobium marinisediminis]
MRAIEGIKGGKFVVIGRVGMDLSPLDRSQTERASEMFVAMGGSSANTAAGLVKLGLAADLVTCVSDDAVGRYCLNQLDHYGVGRSHVRTIQGEERTSLAIYETRVEDHQSVIYRNNAADFRMDFPDVEGVDYSRFTALITAGTVFAAEPSRSAAFRAFELAKAAGLPIIFDIDYRPYSWPSPQVAAEVLSRAGDLADVVVGNDEEFGFMAGDIDKGRAKARDLARSSAEIVVYKMGQHGAITYVGDEEIPTGIFPAEAVKPTGAGDSFMAGFMSGLARGQDMKTAILRGSACASIVVSRPGCAPAMPDHDQLEAFLKDHPGPTAGPTR